MLLDKASVRSERRFRFGNAGAINMEYVFAGGLALIIVAALGLTIYHFMGGPGGASGEIPEEAWFRCMECKHEFAIKTETLTKTQMMSQGMGPMLANCPKCGEEEGAVEMSLCPKCEKYYVPEGFLDPRLFIEGDKKANVCEHCGLDVQEYRRKEMKEMQKKKK